MKFNIEGTNEIRYLEHNGVLGSHLTAETFKQEGTDIVYNRKNGAYIISLRDFARWRRLLERLEAAEDRLVDTIRKTRTRRNSEAINEIIENETEFLDGIDELPGAYEKIVDRIEDEIALPLFSGRRPMSGIIRKALSK